eukprot:TRINITY_DN4672_c0_g1_i1.p4 TRINITY_DN4672_c0_g1~~TRINITY_DN4672_c0_g1_i1.p4  ORF type:complete len:136 (-),score=7.55 TRINITY_DN4672_c0_g1_i1:634-1041(-)
MNMLAFKRVVPILRPALARQFGCSVRVQGLEEFVDLHGEFGKEPEHIGRSWSAQELRLKSFDDLHKLWFVLLKEKNFLLSEKARYRKVNMEMPRHDRLHMVKKSMNRIKQTLAQRALADPDPKRARELQLKINAI